MKSFRTRRGPFRERPYYKASEIDNMCIDELHRVGLLPSTPEPIRIDRFIEKRFGAPVEYAELPNGILGYTRFNKSGVVKIVVASSLDDKTTTGERRIRSTLAHEAGHGLLHAHLFALSGQSTLFPEGQTETPRVLCRDVHDGTSSTTYDGQWWEYQANRTIGGFLLPTQLVAKAIDSFLTPTGLLGLKDLPCDHRAGATSHLAAIFDVNPAVATIRLGELFPEEGHGQQVL